MKKYLFLILSIILISCSKGGNTPEPTPQPQPQPQPSRDKVFLTVRYMNIKAIPTHEKTYGHTDGILNKLGKCMRTLSYSDFQKDSTAIYAQFLEDVQKVINEYSGKYYYGTVTVGKSFEGASGRMYETEDIRMESAKNAFIFISYAKGREKSRLEEDLQTLTNTLDAESAMVTTDDIDTISPLVEELLSKYENNLVCGSVSIYKIHYLGEEYNTERIKDWNMRTVPTLYELATSDNDYHTVYGTAYQHFVAGIEFNKPQAAESESKAVAVADEVYNYLNGHFFKMRMALESSDDCFETSHTIKNLNIEMAGKVWGVEPEKKTSVLRSTLQNLMVELEPTGVCYSDDHHEFKEKVREACKKVKDVDETLNIVECHRSVYYRDYTIVDTVIIR